ncbi:hypothetical protein ERC79_12025 [Rhodococcus sp. ABRD24]|uniref:hypothetical protein n=1 Tax=Rhodococcus sp. ABRD24 TaxID=2507582 RepID=UPI00103CC51E|nr:hypothetical protein [Rhodococcus sp. ABRD24]QBJ96613.1 hypothetical protein ERC79_12025 [Rhodococcus sp. ABRD24]
MTALVAAGLCAVAAVLAYDIIGGSVAVEAPTPACPPTTRDHDFGPTRAGSAELMVPGSPVAATACRYDGIRYDGSAPLGLTRAGLLSGEVLDKVVEVLNESVPTSPTACRPVDGRASAVSVIFRYESGPLVEVRWGTDRCGLVTNGIRSAKLSTVAIPPYWG